MWRCPKCSVVFEEIDQAHDCVESESPIDDYIALQREEIQSILFLVRNTIRTALPGAEEKISWGMPTFRRTHNIFHFSASKNHLGIYPGPEAIEHFSDKLKSYKSSKGAVQFPYVKPIPFEVIAEMAKWCDETGFHH